jgi:hypothetical protein
MAAPGDSDNTYNKARMEKRWREQEKQWLKQEQKKQAAASKELENERRRAEKAKKQREAAAASAKAAPPPPSKPSINQFVEKRIQMLKILGNPRDSVQDIRRAYHALALKYHPDKCGSDVRFKEILAAYEYLTA